MKLSIVEVPDAGDTIRFNGRNCVIDLVDDGNVFFDSPDGTPLSVELKDLKWITRHSLWLIVNES